MSLLGTMAFRAWRRPEPSVRPPCRGVRPHSARTCQAGASRWGMPDHGGWRCARATRAPSGCPMCHAGNGIRVALRVARRAPTGRSPPSRAAAGRHHRSPGLLGYFERLVDPYPDSEPPPPPKGVLPFIWACTAGVRRFVLGMTVATAIIGAFEALLFAV